MPDPNEQTEEFHPRESRAPIAIGVSPNPLDDICKTYGIAMVRIRQHVGEGNEGWSDPLCPRIHQLGGKGCVCKGEVPNANMSGQEREAVAEQARRKAE